jgi:hypothetical protein
LVGVALFAVLTTFAGAPEGHPSSLDPEVKQALQQALGREGYRCQQFERNASAYLWDNRHRLATTSFPIDQQINVLVCVLSRKGYSGLEAIASSGSFGSWCEHMLQARDTPSSK